ncbi:MAG: methyl-accepting chemotaxis protein [Acidimicrobiales bacterium]
MSFLRRLLHRDSAPPTATLVAPGRSEAARHDDALAPMLDLLPEMICRFEPDGTLTWVNESYAAYHHTTREALIGTNFMELVDESVRQLVSQHLVQLRSLTPSNPEQRNEHPSSEVSGKLRWQLWTDRALFDSAGRLVSFVSIGRDITAERHRQEEVESLATRVHDEAQALASMTEYETASGLGGRLDEAVSIVDDLVERVTDISRTAETIRKLAEQTSLLALNATIEAARAGEHGKGFSVVAGEVKTLAGSTKASLESIDTLADELTSGVSAVSAVLSGVTESSGSLSSSVAQLREIASTLRHLSQVDG